jgi:ligand-binding sensor domain-containing protein/signal transduction histidine kinase
MTSTKFGAHRLIFGWACLLALALGGFRNAAAQTLDPTKSITQYVHQVWREEDGLPENSVQAAVQTRDGYLWLATEEGLVRFDGIHFTVFDKNNTPQLRSSYIVTLRESHDGSLWIGTSGGGAYRLKDGRLSAYPPGSELSHSAVWSFCEGHDGSMWIGTAGQGLVRWKNGSFSSYSTRDGLSNNFIWTLAEGEDGSLWIGTNGGLNRLKDGRFTVYTRKDGLPSEVVWCLRLGQMHRLWVGTASGLVRVQDGKFYSYGPKDGSSDVPVRSIYEDRQGTLWIGTEGKGLERMKDGKVSVYNSGDGLSNDTVLSILEDEEGSLWLGTFGGGLDRLKDGNFVTYGRKQGLSFDHVNPVYQSRDGSMWIGSDGGGLDRAHNGRVTHYTTKEGLPTDRVWSITEARDGSIWAGTNGSGLARIKNGRTDVYDTKNGLSNDSIRCLLETGPGELWIGTRSGGLNRFQNGKFTVYSTRNGLPSDVIRCLYQDPMGTLWIGTGGGLVAMKNGKFKTYTTQDGLSNNETCSIYRDRDGTFWLGSCTGGLTRFKDNRFTAYTVQQGLFDDVVYQILDDDMGNLWMSCNKGVYRASKKELNDFAAGALNSIHCQSYGVSDGMGSRECDGGFQPAGWKTKDGRLWFPTLKGVAVVDPAHLKADTRAPRVIVEQVLVDDRPVPFQDEITLPPGHRKLQFRYTGLSLSAARQVQFKYQLVGFDTNWVDAGSRRNAYYTNIPPGKYRFRVIACNGDGTWNLEGASVAIVLDPHFYETAWFYALCGLALALGGWGIYLLRLRFLVQRNQELESRVLDRTHELEQQVRAKEEAYAQLAEAQQHLMTLSRQAGMAEVATGVLHNVGNVLNSVNVSATIVANKIRESRITNLAALVGMLQGHSGELPDFLTHDAKGQRIVPYLAKLGGHLEGERQVMLRELELLTGHLGHIKEIVATQQNYAKVSGLNEVVALPDLVEDAIRIVDPGLSRHGIQVEREHEAVPPMAVDKHSVLQILLNLLRNAKQAIKDSNQPEKSIRIRIHRWGEDRVRIEVKDTGVGLPPENLTRIFSHGFTTRRDGHGFGLHSGANAARQLGGALWAESAGLGCGATFILELPLNAKETVREPSPV